MWGLSSGLIVKVVWCKVGFFVLMRTLWLKSINFDISVKGGKYFYNFEDFDKRIKIVYDHCSCS